MSKDNLELWAGVATVIGLICAYGWYSETRTDKPPVTQANAYVEKIDEYNEALYEANDTILRMDGCIDESFRTLEKGYFDDGLYMLDDCRGDKVPSPGKEI